jgi:uncharacterized BrkB/YihY/UPF0761 family membrane protein
MTQENNIQESRSPLKTFLMVLLKTFLMVLFFAFISIGYVFVPAIPLYILGIKFSILNYIYSALFCCVLMIIYIVLETIITKNETNDENDTKSN